MRTDARPGSARQREAPGLGEEGDPGREWGSA